MKYPLRRSMFFVVGASIILALVPAGLILDRRLTSEFREQARRDLQRAPALVQDRNRSGAEVLVVRARAFAGQPDLAGAVRRGDVRSARRAAERHRDSLFTEVLVAGSDGRLWTGPGVGDSIVARALAGAVSVEYRTTEDGLRRVAIAPVPAAPESLQAGLEQGLLPRAAGAAGFTVDVGAVDVGALAGLTQAETLIVDRLGRIVAASGDSVTADWLARDAGQVPADGSVHEVSVAGQTYWVSAASLDEAGRVLFARQADEELALLSELRRGGVIALLFALMLALTIAALFAGTLVEPVESLARAADRLAGGDRRAPIRRSRILEVDRVAHAFSDMRNALSAKMSELQTANRELEERQARLQMLQAEMIQRDRLTASGRLVAELAHEIRNPVASVRNCLEILRRKVDEDDREFADMAIDELLRMHELAEHMLDLNRPAPAGSSASCDPFAVGERVSALFSAGGDGSDGRVEVSGTSGLDAAIPADGLKQVLINLVQNAREAMPAGGLVQIGVTEHGGLVIVEVRDEGHGIEADDLPHVFDPFYTTKGDVRGVGLGLFIADGIVRRYGGSIRAANRTDAAGAVFRIELATAEEEP